MYTLVILGLIALGLLVLGGRRREGLAPNDKIKEFGNGISDYPSGEPDRIWNMLPQTLKTQLVQTITQRIANLPPGTQVPTPEAAAKSFVTQMVSTFYTQKYVSASSPITQADIDTYSAGAIMTQLIGSDAAMREYARQVLKAYYIDQLAPATGGTTTGNSSGGNRAPAPTRYADLKKQFDTKKGEYDALLATQNPSEADMQKLRTLNREMFVILEEAILALKTSQPAEMEVASRELSAVLTRIERDYGALSSGSDRIETLRRIREFEEVRSNGLVNIYAILLLVFAVGLLVIMIFSQRVSASSAMPLTRPPSTANFM